MRVPNPFSLMSGETLPNEDYVAMQKEGEVMVSDFQGSKGKYFSTVVDEKENSKTLRESSKVKILATYITDKGKLTGIKIERYEKIKGKLQPNPTAINLALDQAATLADFLEFLRKADLQSISRGQITLERSLGLDSNLQAKLVSISSDPQGRRVLEAFLEQDYIPSQEVALSAIKLLKGIQGNEAVGVAIRTLADNSSLDIADLIRIGLTPTKISEKLSRLAEFRRLISQPDVKEVSDIQAALQDMPWIFGPEYKSIDVRSAGDSGIPDRRLKRIDGLSDILEIKLPKEEVLRIDSQGRQYMSPKLAESLGQLTGYLEHFYSEYRKEFDDDTKEERIEDSYGKYYKPKGILLIGRRFIKDGTVVRAETSNAQPKFLRRLTSYFHWVDVLTYDDLIEKAENGLKSISE